MNELNNRYQASIQWIQLQQQKAPLVEQMIQEGLQNHVILQNPELLAEYHDKYFAEVNPDNKRNIQLYRDILENPELLTPYYNELMQTQQQVQDQQFQGQQPAQQLQQNSQQPANYGFDWSKSLLDYKKADGSDLNERDLAIAKQQLISALSQGLVDRRTVDMRLVEIDQYNSPAYVNLRRERKLMAQQQAAMAQGQGQVFTTNTPQVGANQQPIQTQAPQSATPQQPFQQRQPINGLAPQRLPQQGQPNNVRNSFPAMPTSQGSSNVIDLKNVPLFARMNAFQRQAG